MNERIKELWSQAGGHYNGGNQHTWPEYTITDPEKFAELIVEECCSLMNQEIIQHNGYGYNQYALHQILREHFGVE